jgi:hypothetical protein
MNLWWAAAIVVTATAVAVLALLLIRRWAPHGGHFADTGRAAGVFGILATSFAVLLAFMIYLAFSAYDGTSSGADTEAELVAQQIETAQLLPPGQQLVLGSELVCYGRAVIHIEWPAMESGSAPPVNPWGPRIFATFRQIQPETDAQNAAYAKWLDQTSAREAARLDRISAVDGVIPAPLWFMLLISAGVVLAFVFFFADRGEGALVQAVQVGAVTAILVSSLLVVRFLDHPYAPGAGSIRPSAMQENLDRIQVGLDRLGITLPELCDAEGRPLDEATDG